MNLNIDFESNKAPFTTDHVLKINEKNRLVLQKYRIQENLPVNISLTATGLGCALAQVRNTRFIYKKILILKRDLDVV